jgi:hypothetical protein
MTTPIIRVSIIRCEPAKFAHFRDRMAEAEAVLVPGIRKLRGCLSFFAGADEATSSLSNVSFWETLADAKQLDTYQPMLDLGKQYVAEGATFERPIMNYLTQWQIGAQV